MSISVFVKFSPVAGGAVWFGAVALRGIRRIACRRLSFTLSSEESETGSSAGSSITAEKSANSNAVKLVNGLGDR